MEKESEQIIFEHPLNERTRTLLRFEYLFGLTDHHSQQETHWNSRAAIDGVLDMYSILTSRTDIKSEILKELGRYRLYFQGLADSQDVDQKLLIQTLKQIEESSSNLERNIGQIGIELREDDFLQSILNRRGIPGGNCSFDLPLYHYWLEQDAGYRSDHLKQWLKAVEPIKGAVKLLLSLMRNSSNPTSELAKKGLFQMALNAKAPARLIRISLPMHLGILPKVSGSRHKFSIRFLKIDAQNQTTEINQDLQFQLTCCTI